MNGSRVRGDTASRCRGPALLSGLLLIGILIVPSSITLGAQKRPMKIVDLINLPSLGDPQLSPDGELLLYTRTDADWELNDTVTHIWRVRTDGSESVQLTNGKDGESSSRWSPDGTRIAFLALRNGNEQKQIWLIHNAGGEGSVLTEHPTEVSSISWSPDGASIYFIAEDEKTEQEKAREKVKDNVLAFEEDWHHRHLWRADVESGATERITEGDFTVRGYEISRDGSMIAHSRAPTPLLDDGPFAEVWVMAADGSGARQLTDNSINERSFELSPDNSRLLFVANSNEEFDYYYNNKLFIVPVAGGTPWVINREQTYTVGGATWSADGERILFTANTGVRQDIMVTPAGGGSVEAITAGDHSIQRFSYQSGLDTLVFTESTPTNAGDIWMLGLGEGAAGTSSGRSRGSVPDDTREPVRVTHVFDYLEEEFLLPRVEAVRYPGEDGVTVEGLVFYPLDYQEGQRYPLVVQTHGGPASSDKFSFDSSSRYVNVLTSMGYMVFKPNYRGSTGYGDDFLRDMVGNYFNQAHKDVMEGVDWLIAEGMVDGERMAKMGWSAGGHMTNKIITYTNRFKAASSGAGAFNWTSMYAQSDTRVYRTPWFGGTPWEEDAPLAQYLRDSPLSYVYKVTTPTIVLVGENDRRVPMAQSVELYRALKSNGVPTHLYVAPKQGHGWRELQQRLFKANVEIDWFERWVMGREYEWEKSPVHGDEH